VLIKNSYLALSLSLIICIITLVSSQDYGITWDEPTYIEAGKSYIEWLKRPSLKTIDEYWKENHEHPPLTKILGGLSNYLFHEKLRLFSNTLSYRISVLLFVFLLNYALFKFVSELYGNRIALVVTLTFSFLPRIFFHSHIGAMDYPVTAMWFLVIYTYWKGVKNQRWIIYSSILLGFSLLTKLNAIFLYAPLSLYWILVHKKEIVTVILKREKANWSDIRDIGLKMVPMIIIPPIIFVSFWPWLWKDTMSRVLEYFTFHINHLKIPVYYFGNVYFKAPWEYPFVLTFITVPIIVLIPFLIGMIKIYTTHPRNTNILIVFNALIPLFIVSISQTKYDGIRLFLPAFPFICMVSGVGLHHISNLLQKLRLKKIAYFAYAFSFLFTIYISIVTYYPYHASYFNEIIGGIDGALEKGFEPEYWGSAYKGLIPWLEENPESVYWIYINHTKPDPLYHYQTEGLLNPNIKFGGKHNSDYLILLSRFGMYDKDGWIHYKNKEPVFSVRISHTNLVGIYRLDQHNISDNIANDH
jgi:4-amino-4-deoxy-L-arabinose transferase-like glycosyltransferase